MPITAAIIEKRFILNRHYLWNRYEQKTIPSGISAMEPLLNNRLGSTGLISFTNLASALASSFFPDLRHTYQQDCPSTKPQRSSSPVVFERALPHQLESFRQQHVLWHKNAVSRNLIACLQAHKIIDDKLVWFDKGIFPSRMTQTLWAVIETGGQSAVLHNLLHNTNDQVCKNHAHEAVHFCTCPLKATSSICNINYNLKKSKLCSAIIWAIDLVLTSVLVLTLPADTLSAASFDVKPSYVSSKRLYSACSVLQWHINNLQSVMAGFCTWWPRWFEPDLFIGGKRSQSTELRSHGA